MTESGSLSSLIKVVLIYVCREGIRGSQLVDNFISHHYMMTRLTPTEARLARAVPGEMHSNVSPLAMLVPWPCQSPGHVSPLAM